MRPCFAGGAHLHASVSSLVLDNLFFTAGRERRSILERRGRGEYFGGDKKELVDVVVVFHHEVASRERRRARQDIKKALFLRVLA